MSYFQNFPAIYYEFVDSDGSKQLRTVVDITQNIRIISSILDSITLYDEYDIMDMDTPEILSHKIYGSSMYHWVIMIANQRFDYANDWPLTSEEFEVHVRELYGEESEGRLFAVHHYIDSNGYVVNNNPFDAKPVSNYRYEYDKNEAKRRIKIISPRLLSRITNQFDTLISP